MTRLVCPYDTGDPPCPIGPDDRTCPVHLDDLVPGDPDPPPAPGTADAPHSAEDLHTAGGTDPAGGSGAGATSGDSAVTGTRDPDRDACWQCRQTLPEPAAPDCPRCHAAQPGPALALIFSTGTITLERGERTRLGRAKDTPHAAILSAPNISNLHAVAWVDDDGTPWIKDTHSTNGTFVNGEVAQPEVPCRLTCGTLRLGADNRARIHVQKGDR